jgi:hypothetical protein
VAFAVVVRFATGVAMADKQRQEMPVGATGLGVRVSAPMVRRGERLGQVEGYVDRYERIKRERKQAEPRGPDGASPLSRSHTGASVGMLCRTNLTEW